MISSSLVIVESIVILIFRSSPGLREVSRGRGLTITSAERKRWVDNARMYFH